MWSTPVSASAAPALQCQTLLAFYKATFGNQWVEHTGWFADINPCVWHGILSAAGDAGAVTQIELDTNNLGGTIDTVNWAGLPSLSIFDINENQVTGTDPGVFGGPAAHHPRRGPERVHQRHHR